MNTLVIMGILQATMAAVPLDKFVPFGHSSGDNEVPANDDGFISLDLKYEMPFFGINYKRLWVNNNGGISFNGGVRTYTPICAPIQDAKMVMAFWADVMTLDNDVGKVYYREDHNPALLRSLAAEILRAYPSFQNLRLSSALVVTWVKVSFFRVNTCADPDDWPRNTFQAILVTDQSRTFAIFNYNKIVWTTGTASGGNCSGLGSSSARIGFDAGDGENLIMIDDSCTDSIMTVVDKSNVGVPGKFIFRIDGTDIDVARCDSTKYKTEKLLVTPKFVDTWGHQPLTLKGPCFNETHNVTCIFHDIQKGWIEVPALLLGESVVAVCQVPYLYGIGRIKVGLRVTNETQTDEYSGFLYVVNPFPSINVSRNFTTLSVFWDPHEFANITNVSVKMVKYGSPEFQWSESLVVAESAPNTGSYLGPLSPTITEDDAKYVYGFMVETAEAEQNFLNKIVRFSGYFTAQTTKVVDLGESILNSMCYNWYLSDPGPPTNLLPCPPTLTHARLDVRFLDEGFSPFQIAFYHLGGRKTFRSRLPTPLGSGQQCVYDHHGHNMVGSFRGGTADLVSPDFNNLGHVWHDILPWLWCCKPGDLGDCQKYYYRRPSNSGSNYKPPAMARGNGDPHIVTFDSAEYTFNGAGEFWMIINTSSNPTLLMQGRTEVYGNAATVFTAFVFQQPGGSKLQLSLNGPNSLRVWLDDYPLELQDPQLWTQNFIGATLTQNQDPPGVSISFTSGFDFIIGAAHGALRITAAANRNNYGKVAGLLGYFDGDKQNDLRTPDGKIISASSNLTDIHYKFGLKWMITESESLFYYSKGKNYSTYSMPNFLPFLQEPNPNELPQSVRDVCDTSKECVYDYLATRNVEFANSTKQYVKIFHHTVDHVRKNRIVVCPEIPNDIHTFVNGTIFSVGGNLTFSCFDDDYHLVGADKITCQVNGNWSATPPLCQRNTTTGTLANNTLAITKGSASMNICFAAVFISVINIVAYH